MILSDIFNRSFTLSSNRAFAGTPLTSRATPTIRRVSPANLEMIYMRNPVVFHSINALVQIIMSASKQSKLIGSDKSVNAIESFLNSIGQVGTDIDWQTIQSLVYTHLFIQGLSPVELIRNKKTIIDLNFIDPKSFDYAKNNMGNIMLDKYLRPVGYTQEVPFGMVPTKTIPPPKGVSLSGNKIFLPPERVVVFKAYEVGDRFYPLGLIEAAYDTCIRHDAAEAGYANAQKRLGYPLFNATIGDLNHPASEQHLQSAVNDLKDINERTSYAHPDWVKLEILEPRHPEKLRNVLDYYIEQEITNLGLPRAFALETGKDTNRNVLERQEYMTKLLLKDIIYRTNRKWETQVFAPICKALKLPDVPKYEWGEITFEDLDMKAERLARYAKQGLITPDKDLESHIRTAENLPKKSES